MESNYNNENFEELLRESSDQYRMYPSESVWKNVYSSLHTRRRWFGIGFTLLLSAGFVTTIMMTNSASGTHPVADQNTLVPVTREPALNTDPEKILLVPSDNSITGAEALNKDKIALFEQQAPVVDDDYRLSRPTTVVPFTINETPVETTNRNAGMLITTTDNLGPAEDENTPVATNAVYTPITLVLSDATTDQDSWIFNNGSRFTNETAGKKLHYRMQTAYYPLTIESVINSYTRRNKKLSFQFYFTPTISYRKLSENKSYVRSATNTTSVYNNINNVVTHKPDMGIELGVAARYSIGRNVKLRGGLQFNTSRYDIKAFSYATEVTTIALNSGNYTADSLNTMSSYRNFNGYKSDWLHNFYFQISAPIGIEFKLAGDDKIQFGVASTIQPTYVLGDRAYLLSSNYKNYAEVPSLMRRWNMNASFEAFVSYSTGKMNWQVGPQIRYQLQSSFVKEYPVKENLFDFGLKIGVSANK